MLEPKKMELSPEDLKKMYKLQLMIFSEIDRLCTDNEGFF